MKQDKLLCSLIAGSLILQGCTDKPKDKWLVGMWNPMEESCEGEAYLDFKATGQFGDIAMSEGTWKLEDTTIVLTTTSEFDDDTLESKPVKTPPIKLQITSYDTNTFSAVGADGTTVKWKRCSFGSDKSTDRESTEQLVDIQEKNVPKPEGTYISCYYSGAGITIDYRIIDQSQGSASFDVYDESSNEYKKNRIFTNVPVGYGSGPNEQTNQWLGEGTNSYFSPSIEFWSNAEIFQVLIKAENLKHIVQINRRTGAMTRQFGFADDGSYRYDVIAQCEPSESRIKTEAKF